MSQASSSSAGYAIEDVYKSVISDVISSIKEIFLDESIDIDVLNQLKNEWENKVNASGALDYDSNRSIPPPAVRQPQQIKQQPMSQIYVPQPVPGPSNFLQQQQASQQRVATGFVQPGSSNFAQPSAQQQQRQAPPNVQPANPPAVKSDFAGVKQLDGGPGMTDSSSSEDEDEDDQMSRFIGLQDEHANDAEAGDEDPLNSNDDQSDDEDLETLFNSNNLIVCQFEKVNRARTRWKFSLKDGIMHLNGKDYCFQKCIGEAEW